ncbi:MAG: transglutaminase-like cysteine peptidase [Alphaproteobacteria bacterium]
MRRFLARVLSLAAALCCAMTAAASGAELGSRTLSLFNAKAQRVDDTVIFTKWNRTVTRHNFQISTHVDPCGTPKNESCFLDAWRESLIGMEKQPKRAQLELVNKHLNASPYVLDIATWSTADYWETPLEFLMFSGDCEDYAIAKFFSLLRLGFSNEQMQIVIVQDQNLRVPHAILAVTLDGANYILDNQIPQVVRDTLIHHYTPMYGLNLASWWRFSGKSNALTPDSIAPKP